jgi:dolichol-phosphate mannosyltransferase
MGSKKQYNLGIVIPTYNEKENINELLMKIDGEVSKSDHSVTLLIVDDGSPDKTGEIVERLISSNKYKHISLQIMHRKGKQGLASAYKQGFSSIKDSCEYVMSMDADLSHNPKYILPMLKTAQSGYDCVIGSRYVKGGGIEGWGPVRLLISRLGSLYSQIILMTKVKDQTGGFNLYSVDMLNMIDLNSIKAEGYMFQIEMKYTFARLKQRIKEYPIIFTDRIHGSSKISRKIVLEAFVRVPLLKLGL